MAYPQAFLDEAREQIIEDPFYLAETLNFETTWFHKAWLTFCLENQRHAVEAPRGFGKSTICTTLLSIWRILRDPNVRILVVSKTETQASRFLREIRGHLEGNRLLIEIFGEFLGPRKWTDTALVVSQRTAVHKEATVTAVGLEGPIIGGHWDLILIDDPFDEESSRSELLRDRAYEWLFVTLQPALNPGGSVGVRCTRYHFHDLAGRIERELATDQKTGETCVYRVESADQPVPAAPRDPRWKVLQMPAVLADGASLWETRFPLDDRVNPDGSVVAGLRTIRAEMGERRFGEQFLMICEERKSVERETVFKRSWLHQWDARPAPERLRIYQFVDPAWTSAETAAQRSRRERDPDYFAVVTIGVEPPPARFVYVLDAWRDRVSPDEGLQRAADLARLWRPLLVGIERTGLQIVMARDFYRRIREAIPAPVRMVTPQRNKVLRAEPFALACEQGRIRFNPALHDLFEELVEFPFGEHDDLVDAASGAFLLAQHRVTNLRPFLEQGGARGAADDPRSVPRGQAPPPSNRAVPPPGGFL